MNVRQIQLTNEFAQARDTLVRIDAEAEAAGTITAAQQAEHDATARRMNEITLDLERIDGPNRIAAVTASVLGTGSPAGDTLGEQLITLGRAEFGKLGVAKYAGDVTAAETLQRVVAHGVSSDGTAPVTIEGDLVKFVDANRYAVNGARRLPMPDNHAPTFKRPRLTQRTTVGTQAAEGDVLSSQRIQVTGDTVTKVTKGGVLALSEQEIDWTEPSQLALAIQDLAESYAIDTDNFLCDAIEAAATANDANETILAATLPTSAAFIAAISAASAVAYAASKKIPDVLFVDTNWWSRITAIVDLDGRPVYSATNQMNANGVAGVGTFAGNVAGLNLIVDPNFTADFMAVGVSSLVEFYEQNKGLLSIAAPSTLEVQYAYRGYVAANVYTGIAPIEAV